jgi:hypothetical protein
VEIEFCCKILINVEEYLWHELSMKNYLFNFEFCQAKVPKIDVLAGWPDEPIESVDGGELGAEFTPTLAHCVALQQARTGRQEK